MCVCVHRSSLAAVVGLVLLTLFSAACRKATTKEQYFESGKKYFAQEKYAEAVVEYKNAVKIDPKWAPAHQELAPQPPAPLQLTTTPPLESVSTAKSDHHVCL